MSKKILIILLISSISLFSQEDEFVDSLVKSNPMLELSKDISNLLDNPDFNNANIGISVYSVDNSEYFFRLNDSKNFIPASTNKLLTSAAALYYLGKDFVYTTKVFLDGNFKSNGEFFGDIYIRGMGDPTFSSYYGKNPEKIIEKWVDILDSLGIQSINGQIIGDDNYFDDVPYPPGWSWDDFNYKFSAETSALTINDNCVDIIIMQGDSIKAPAKISFFPNNSYIRILNNVVTKSDKTISNIIINREVGTNFIEINGEISFNSNERNSIKKQNTIDNPTLFFLNIFKNKLLEKQIRFRGALLDIDDWNSDISYLNLSLIIIEESPKLSEIIKIMNQESHNLTAECILKTIAKETSGIGSFDFGADKVLEFLKYAGISKDNIVIVDGSGLSRFNLISPRYQIAILNWIYRSDYKNELLASFAKPSMKGTLERRLKRTLAEKSVIAKTGSMNNVNNITGFVKTRDGETLAFSIMLNNFTVPASLAQNLQDLILMRLASFTRN